MSDAARTAEKALLSPRRTKLLAQAAVLLLVLILVGLSIPVVLVARSTGWDSSNTAAWVQASGSVAALVVAIALAGVTAVYRFASNTRVAVAVCERCVEVLQEALATVQGGTASNDYAFARERLARMARALEQLPYIPMSRYVTAAIDLATILDLALQTCAAPADGGPKPDCAALLTEQTARAQAILADIRREFWWFRRRKG